MGIGSARTVTAICILTTIAGLAAPTPLGPGAAQAVGTSALTFTTTTAPESFKTGHMAGETGIGVDPNTNAVMFQMDLDTARVTFDGSGDAHWASVASPITSTDTSDPILWTDPHTGRTLVAQLTGPTALAAFTDDDGATWTPFAPQAAPSHDHQTIGSGPYPPGTLIPHTYPDALYYCLQTANVAAQCSRSDDGGTTWLVPAVANPELATSCISQHGHVLVAPDGAVILPDRTCNNIQMQGVLVSKDAGLTWTAHFVPGLTSPIGGDPSFAMDAAGKLYFLGRDGNTGHALVTTSTDEGVTWSAPIDVGAAFGIQNAEFPMAIAGDAGRAALAFYGTSTAGNDQAGCGCETPADVHTPFQGDWHVYVAQTLNGGAAWSTVDITPTDSVQHGCIWLTGGGNRCRNLLDFQQMTVDNEGRILVGYADGCTPRACLKMTPKLFTDPQDDQGDSLGTIARQATGPRLYARFDPPGGVDPLTAVAGGPYSTTLNTPIVLSASSSGGVAPYAFAWDLTNSGMFTGASGPTASFSANATGTFPIAVRVSDTDGAAVVATTTVLVRPSGTLQGPIARWTFDGTSACTDQEGWTSASNTNGQDTTAIVAWHLESTYPVPGRTDVVTAGGSSAPCFWHLGDNAVGTHPDTIKATLESPGTPRCVAIPQGVTAASLSFTLHGVASAGSPVIVTADACDGSRSIEVGRFSGIQNDANGDPIPVSLDVSNAISLADVRVKFTQTVANTPTDFNGYDIDTIEIDAG